MADEVRFAGHVKAHLRALSPPERAAALEAIERQLLHEPLVESRKRKPLGPNPIAPPEMRAGKLCVFYEVAPGEPAIVRILAVGKKERNILHSAR